MAYIKCSHVSLSELWQNNINNPEAYSEPGQTSKIECFGKIVNGYLKAVNHFRIKLSMLDVWQGSEYASEICYSLFGKTEDPNNIDSVAV